MVSRRALVAAALAALSALASPVAAQVLVIAPPTHRRASDWSFDFGGQMAQPIGALSSQIDRAWGAGASVRYHLPRLPLLGARADAAWLNYGNEHQRVPLSPTINRVDVDMNTANDIALITVGPELAVPSGPVRPYAFAFAGFSYFYTQSSVGDENNGGAFASSTNYHDGGLARGWGGGLRMPLGVRSVNVAIDAGARITRNGTRTYLRRGDIIDQPDGSLLFNPRTTRADFWQYQIAVSFAPRAR